MKLLVVDNYDSFVFNLARYLERLGATTEVVRNDATDVAAVRGGGFDALVISPGPCRPHDAGVSLALVRELSGELPLLGVCLGHQAIGEVFGGRVVRAQQPLHGRASALTHTGQGLFRGLRPGTRVGRYNSLVVEESPALEDALVVDARSPEGEVMALRHRAHPTFGVQFHPESVLSEEGEALLQTFLTLAQAFRA